MANLNSSPAYMDFGDEVAVYYQDHSHLIDKDGFDEALHTEMILFAQDVANAKTTMTLTTESGEDEVYKILPSAVLPFFLRFDGETVQTLLRLVDPAKISKTLKGLGIEPRSETIKSVSETSA